MDKVDIYASGVCSASVCVPKDMEHDEIERQVNAQSPTGIESRWQISEDKFADGSDNPCPCSERSECSHYLLNC